MSYVVVSFGHSKQWCAALTHLRHKSCPLGLGHLHVSLRTVAAQDDCKSASKEQLDHNTPRHACMRNHVSASASLSTSVSHSACTSLSSSALHSASASHSASTSQYLCLPQFLRLPQCSLLTRTASFPVLHLSKLSHFASLQCCSSVITITVQALAL